MINVLFLMTAVSILQAQIVPVYKFLAVFRSPSQLARLARK